MENEIQSENPYLAEVKPFIGRETVIARLHQHLSNPPHASVPVVIGRNHIGKTALLNHFQSIIYPDTISIYLPLQQIDLSNDLTWTKTLIQTSLDILANLGYVPTGIKPAPEEDTHLGLWFINELLPTIFRVIRSHQRLVLLVDDAEELTKTIKNNRLTHEIVLYLNRLRHPQLGIILTMNVAAEDSLYMLEPLVDTHSPIRLPVLTQAMCTALIRDHQEYAVNDSATEAIFKATGGEPALVQRFGYYLYEQAKAVTTPQDIRKLIPQVYVDCIYQLEQAWNILTSEEKLVLAAISNLRFKDPLATIDTGAIESWLIQTDYPLDATTVNAAIRGLEYHDLVLGSTSEVKLSSSLMQKWVMENASFTLEPINVTAPPTDNQTWIIVSAVIVLILALILVFTMNASLSDNESDTPPPTVTLVNEE